MTVRMALAEALHHRCGVEPTEAKRGQNTASAAGRRPDELVEPGAQGQERSWTFFPRRLQVAPEPQPLAHLGTHNTQQQSQQPQQQAPQQQPSMFILDQSTRVNWGSGRQVPVG